MSELDRELEACLKAGEYLDALDICEEIEESGKMQVKHWLAMGKSLVELRRKADARRVWLKALELEENQPEAIESLNKHFPGWRNEVARSTREASAKPAVQARRRAPAAPPAAPPAAETMVSSPGPSARVSEPPPPAPRAARPVAASPASPASSMPSDDALVNWTYILEDVADAEVSRASR